jgi:chromate transporter
MLTEAPVAPPNRFRAHASSVEVLFVFLRLGCTSFGGPIAHLGYFRKELVERRKWCSESTLAEIIAIAQSIPGPASSQTGFALGILRAGWLGGLAAWVGFTLPSALLMLAFAYGHSFVVGKVGGGLLHGLQIVAVAVVAQAVFAMQRSLAPDRTRIVLAVAAAALALFLPPQVATIAPIVLGAAAGLLLVRSGDETSHDPADLTLSKRAGAVSAVAYFLLLVALPLLSRVFAVQGLDIFSAFYQAGALVFGGGHVVLPLLENTVVARGWVAQQSFLAGYGAAQALPGPLFSIGAYLGASIRPATTPFLSGLLALIGIFTPGMLAMAAVLPFWNAVRGNRSLRCALSGINASVVGILIAALIHPLWTSTILHVSDFCIALLAFALLTVWRIQPWLVVTSVAAVSIMISLAQ